MNNKEKQNSISKRNYTEMPFKSTNESSSEDITYELESLSKSNNRRESPRMHSSKSLSADIMKQPFLTQNIDEDF